MSKSKSPKIPPIQILIKMPGSYYRQPLISRLISRYRIGLNIKAAYLELGERNDGLFNIELFGKSANLINCLSYLQSLKIDLLEVKIPHNVQYSIQNLNSHFPTNNIDLNNFGNISLESSINSYDHQLLNHPNPWIIKSWNPQSSIYVTCDRVAVPTLREAKATEHREKIEIIDADITRLKAKLYIDKKYHSQPIISQLVSKFGVTINITSAILKLDTKYNGYFDLDIWGKEEQIKSVMYHLEKLGLSFSIS